MARRNPLGASLDANGRNITYRAFGIWHMLPWAWPWLLILPVLILAALARGLWGQTAWGPVGVTVATIALAALAYRAGRARGPVIRSGAAAGVGIVGAWLLTITIVGFHRPVTDVGLILAICLPTAANLVHALRGDGQDGAGGWGELAEKVKLPGARAMNTERKGPKVTAIVQAGAGQTAEDIQGAVPRIAAAMGTPTAGARAVPDPNHAGRAKLTLVTQDVLSRVLAWPGAAAAGASILEPIVCGVREDGSPLRLWLPADERAGRSAQHVLVAGMTGSGKSMFGRLVLAEALTRADVEVWLIDQVKGRQFAGPFADRVHRMGTTDADAQSMIGELPALIAARADELGARGLDNWRPDAGFPYLLVLIEEAASSISTSRPFVRAAQTARSAGVSLITSLQRPTHTNLPVDARQQMGVILQFGCRKGDEGFALSPSTVDAGARPQDWGNSKPGLVYAETPGSPPEEWSAPARVYFTPGEAISAALAGSGASADLQDTQILPERGSRAVLPEYTPAEARAALRSAIATLRQAGHSVLRPADLADIRSAIDRSPAWLTGELARLVDAGELVAGERGVYRFKLNGVAR